jgi:hypothetical protein
LIFLIPWWYVGASLHPLTKHFFVKGFREDGADEIIALIRRIEATLMLPDEKGTKKIKKRYKKLVSDETARKKAVPRLQAQKQILA